MFFLKIVIGFFKLFFIGERKLCYIVHIFLRNREGDIKIYGHCKGHPNENINFKLLFKLNLFGVDGIALGLLFFKCLTAGAKLLYLVFFSTHPCKNYINYQRTHRK
jgi:hypothetical protein